MGSRSGFTPLWLCRNTDATAQEVARRAGVPRLYALTELPDLYSKLNWSILSNDGADFVMICNFDGGE